MVVINKRYKHRMLPKVVEEHSLNILGEVFTEDKKRRVLLTK
jgi:hypothetical protein